MNKLKFFLSVLVLILVGINTAVAPGSLFAENVEEIEDNATEINVKNAEIEALIKVFSRKTKRNYILDERVKGTVSIYLPGKVSPEEAIYILDSVLALKGFTSVPIGENLWKIIPAAEAKQTTVPVVDTIVGRGSASVVTKFVNLKYVAADNVRELLSSLISSYGLVSTYSGTNSLIIIDSEDNIKRLSDIIDRLDVPSSDSELVIIPVEHAEANEIVDKITQILNLDSSEDTSPAARAIPVTNNLSRASSGQAAQVSSTTAVSVSLKPKDPKVIADERTNSVIVVADESTTARIRALIDQLDSSVDLSGNGFYVYRCQHASAEELAEVLSGLSGGGGARSSSTSSSGSSLSSNNRSSNRSTRSSSANSTSGSSRGTTSKSSGVNSVQLGDNLSITADPATNSLIIVASKSDYKRIKNLLTELDIKRRQVVVEALILEVGVDDSRSLTAELSGSIGGLDGGVFASNTYGNLANLLSNPTQLQDFTLAAASSGSLTLPGNVVIPSQSILVQAAQNNSNVNVLSSPTIIATDNEEAEIIVGSNVPFISSTASNQTALNNVFNQIERQDVGITLRLTPQISSGDFVTLDLFTEVSNVIPGTEGSELGPTTTIRTSNTTVIAKDSQMIVIGGLMSDNITNAERGIPFLKDIPIIGGLFRTSSETQKRTNLLIFITPRVVKDQFDARDFTINKRDKLEEVIDSYEIIPDRSEELGNEEVNKVIDGQIYEGELPSTIRGNKRKEKVDSPVEQKQASPLVEKKTSQNTVEMKPGRFFVLEIKDSLPEGVWPDLLSGADGDLLGIRLPPEVNKFVSNFFSLESQVKYRFNGQTIPMEVISSFNSQADAEEYYPNLASHWYSLPPRDILNLGFGPWEK